ncbi:MAG: thioredoxin family protein [Bacteroidetes bacterium]|nr:thioredoxin family protein [Bacteroidota bacterium]MCW5896202.1 thioredoxin family protein [Bacteroidota bacterium]
MNCIHHFILIGMLLLAGLDNLTAQSTSNTSHTNPKDKPQTPLVTFVELGSVKCIPCRQMQPVMKAIEEKYGEQIRVVFYDVLKDDQVQYADKYRIRVIPTQVFLDKDGKEFFRHEGFYPEAEIDKLLQKRGLKILKGK